MWQQSPKRIYKRIRGTAVVWDLAIRGENGFALLPDDTAQVEPEAWSKLWQPGSVRLRSVFIEDPSAWHCPAGKARFADGRGMWALKLLPHAGLACQP
eukprot:6456998-Amphidinium_carterae.1